MKFKPRGKLLYPGGKKQLLSRGWKTQFSDDQKIDLKHILKNKYSSELVSQMESLVAHVMDFATRVRVTTLSDEKKQAENTKLYCEKFINIFGRTSENNAQLSPIEGFEHFIRNQMGDNFPNQFFTNIFKMYSLSSDYLEKNEKMPKRNAGDIKYQFAFNIATALYGHIRLGKGRDTKFHRVLKVAFKLLGKDCVKDPYIYTKVADSFPRNPS